MAAKSKFRRRVPGPEVDSALVAHVKGCEKDACACRIVAFNEQKWCPELPIVTDMVICGLEGASWEILEMARRLHNEDATWFKWEITPDGDFQASCQVCQVILKRGFQFLTKGQCKLTRLKRHAMGPQHVASVCQMLGVTVETDRAAPTAQQFQEALKHLQHGQVGPLSGTAGRLKINRMEFVMVEAVRVKYRDALRDAMSINILRDERHKRLLIWFRCANQNLEVTEGVLGQLKDNYSSTSLGLAAASLQLIRDFCTPGAGNPDCADNDGLQVDEALYHHIRHTIHSTTVDSASNEVTCARDMSSELVTGITGLLAGETPLPNHRLIVRDRAHGTRRCLQRPWQADEYLNAVTTGVVLAPTSICQIIEHSFDFKQWYAEATSASSCKAVSTSFQNLRAAQHRYETLVTPIARFVLDIGATIAVATRIAEERSGTGPGRYANDFLAALDAEFLVTCGLLADAGEETLQLIRFYDQPAGRVDPAEANTAALAFLDRVTHLFLDERVWEIEGYTKSIVKWLETTHTFPVSGKVTCVGGPLAVSPQLRHHCLQRLKAWVMLCKVVIAAEFPEFEAVASMVVFDVSNELVGNGFQVRGRQPVQLQDLPEAVMDQLHRLAQTFKCDADEFAKEWYDYRPRAHIHLVRQQCGNLKAWQMALEETRGRPETRASHPQTNLGFILACYASISVTDSNIERHFSKADQRISPQQRKMKGPTESRRMTTLTIDTQLLCDVMRSCKELWLTYFRPARLQTKERIDKGRLRQSRLAQLATAEDGDKPTEIGFRKRRRESVTAAVQTGNATQLDDDRGLLDDGVWTEGHAREQTFMQQKRQSRKVECLVGGGLLRKELDQDLLLASVNAMQTFAENRGKRARHEARLHKQVIAGQVPTPLEHIGAKVHVEDADRTYDLDQQFAIYHWQMTQLGHADIFLADPGVLKLDTLKSWALVLRGAWLLRPDWAMGQVYNGPAIKFHAAVALKRWVWMSPAVKAELPDLAALISCAAESVGSKWNMVDNLEQWAHRKEKCTKDRHPAEAIALVNTAEQQAYQGVKHVFDPPAFFKFIGVWDKASSKLAVGNM